MNGRPAPSSAVALAYRDDEGAPRVVAKGAGLVAAQIISKAQEAGVFVHESKELVALLMQVDLDREIPPALYRVVAELLAWLYHIESSRESGGPQRQPALARPDDTPRETAGHDADHERH